ncbi:hypothetical protein OG801_01570 [Nocardioides sp. NBC_00163]|uniref:YczE/YyaS/YitT family protein n=1 Tax=Nocardioides sp. NBC_00163 TaxID=2975999 RepID=UPI003253BE1E
MSRHWPVSRGGRFIQLAVGLLIAATGIWLSIRANLGVASWEVLHIALADRLGIGVGTASIGVGVLLVTIVALLGVRPGAGTLLNVLIIGVALNVLLDLPALASLPSDGLPVRLGALAAGIVVFAIGCAIYVGAHLGSGPRDGLMLAVHLRTGLGIGSARILSEGIGLATGWLLGGPAGLGTVLFVLTAGPCVAIAFKALGLRPLAPTSPHAAAC